jgi:adenylosuccinate synthase
LLPYVGEAEAAVADAVAARERVLFEGAHGTLLDIDGGTYPYVTSTHTTAGGACIGTGIGPLQIGHVLGVVKAYQTRVGEGPMPTELVDAQGDDIRERGKEYGTSTGRPRRCGWLDLVALRYAVRINGLDMLALTRLDVLSGITELLVCTKYRIDGVVTGDFPTDTAILERAEPVYEPVSGWLEDITGCRSEAKLPTAAWEYVSVVAAMVGVPIVMISVGAERDATILPIPDVFWGTRTSRS